MAIVVVRSVFLLWMLSSWVTSEPPLLLSYAGRTNRFHSISYSIRNNLRHVNAKKNMHILHGRIYKDSVYKNRNCPSCTSTWRCDSVMHILPHKYWEILIFEVQKSSLHSYLASFHTTTHKSLSFPCLRPLGFP